MGAESRAGKSAVRTDAPTRRRPQSRSARQLTQPIVERMRLKQPRRAAKQIERHALVEASVAQLAPERRRAVQSPAPTGCAASPVRCSDRRSGETGTGCSGATSSCHPVTVKYAPFIGMVLALCRSAPADTGKRDIFSKYQPITARILLAVHSLVDRKAASRALTRGFAHRWTTCALGLSSLACSGRCSLQQMTTED